MSFRTMVVPATPSAIHRRGHRAGADRLAPHDHGVRHRVARHRVGAGDPQVLGGQHRYHVALADVVLGADQEVLAVGVGRQVAGS